MEATLGGDGQAFEKLLTRYQNDVFNLCFRLLGDTQEAADCAQETFIRAYRSLKGFRREAKVSTWLYTIAVNTCKNREASAHYRRRRLMVSIDPAASREIPGTVLEIEDPAPSPLSQLIDREREALFQKAIDTLPQESKTIVILRDVEGLSYEEIAQISGLPLGTVKSRLARARQQIMENVKGVI